MLRFTMDGPQGRQLFEFDATPSMLTGDEVVLIETITGGSAQSWDSRIREASATGRDVLLVAYLTRHRQNPMLEWEHFIRTIAPFTLQPVVDPPKPAPKPPSKPRASRARKPAAPRKPAAAADTTD
ncbi:hypothetical protein [Pseudonocardia benzenivorans]|uniref:hypothetical protein n=1 Tax=Pseudonocardia benzenivorans TaxID=228005 RepID=UPI0031FA3760